MRQVAVQATRRPIQPISRIQQYLDRATAEACVIWVSAPPGAGKTTQVASYAERRGLPSQWLSYRSSMGIDGLIAAIPDLVSNAPDEASLIVLDDLDSLCEQSLTRICEAVMHSTGPKISWAVISTSRPPVSVIRAQARGDVSVLDWAHLRLQPDEVDQVLRGLGWEESPVGSLLDLLQGWVAGLALLGPAQEAQLTEARIGSAWRETVHRFITTQVLERMSPGARDVLFRVAMLEQFGVDELREICGDNADARSLTTLVNECLFIEPCDVLRYRLHPLLRQVTQVAMSVWLDTSVIRQIWASSAPVLERSGDWRGAASCLARLDEQASLAALLRRVADDRRHHEDPDTWLHWFANLDDHVLEGEPDLQCSLGQLLARRDTQQAMRYLAAAVRGEALSEFSASRIMALCTIFDIELDRAGPRTLLDRAAGMLKDYFDKVSMRGLDLTTRVWAQACLAVHLSQSAEGQSLARDLIMRTLDELGEEPQISHRLRCASLMLRAASAVSAGLAHVIVQSQGSLPDASQCDPHVLIAWFNACAEWQIEQGGDFDAAHNLIVHGLNLAEPPDRCAGRMELLSQQMRLELARSANSKATQILAQMSSQTGQVQYGLHVKVAVARVLLSLSIGDIDGGLNLAESLCEDPSALAAQPLALAKFRRDVALLCANAGEFQTARKWIAHAVCAVNFGLQGQISLNCRDYIELLDGERELNDPGLSAAVAQVHARQQISGISVCLGLTPALASRVICCALKSALVEVDAIRRVVSAQQLSAPMAWASDWPWPVSVRVLGGIEVRCSGELLQSTGKAQQRLFDLLRLLVTAGVTGRTQHFLEAHLWGDSDNPKAALNVAIYRLRKLLGNEQTVLVHGGLVTLHPDLVWTDVRALALLTDAIIAMTEQRRRSQTEALAILLLGLYRGPLEAADDAWLATAAKRLSARLAEAIAVLGGDLESAGLWALAGRLYRRLLDVEPLSELAFRGLIRCAHAQGDSGTAASLFRFCRQTLSILVNAEPSAQTTALARSLGLTIPTSHAPG